MKSKKSIIGLSIAIVVLALFIGGVAFKLLNRESEPVDVRNKADVEWYNETDTEFIITTAEEFYGLVKLAEFYDFKDQTIKLGADIVVNEGNATDWQTKAPALKWYPINNFAGTFDGQGHTISGLYGKAYDVAMSLFANTQSGCNVQNFRLINSYFEGHGNAGVASIGGQGGGTFKQIYSAAIVKGEGKFTGGILSRMTGLTTVEECWFDGKVENHGRMTGGIVASVAAKLTMSHCLNTGEITITWTENAPGAAALCGAVESTNSEVFYNDCLAAGKINSENIYYVGAVSGIMYGNSTSTYTNTYSSMDCMDMALGREGVQGALYGAPIELLGKSLIGTESYRWTDLDFENYWAVVPDGTPILKHFAEEVPSIEGVEKAFSTAWYNESAKEFVINTKEDLYGLYMISGSTEFIGKTIKVGADIVVNEGKASKWSKNTPESYWYPIKKFGGTFDGQGHTISGLYYKGENQKVGLFSETNIYATIKNVNIKNSYFEGSSDWASMIGSIAGRGGGIIDTVYSDAIIVSSADLVGGMIGQINKEGTNKVTNCWYDGKMSLVTEKNRYGGGIVGNVVKGHTTIEHCLNTGELSCKALNMGLHFAGIVGTVMNEGTELIIKDCLNVGNIVTDYHVCVGSVIGRITSTPKVTIADTYAVTESYTNPTRGHMGIGTESYPTQSGGVFDVLKSKLTGYGGYEWTSLDFKNYWAVDLNGTPILKSFAKRVPSVAGLKKKFDISWYKDNQSTYVIDSKEDLVGFAMIAKTTVFTDKTIKLGADIALNNGNAADWATNAPDYEWEPANRVYAFEGTFDGQGHTISGLYVENDQQYTGFFGRTALGSTVKNLRIENSYFGDKVSATPLIGSVAGRGNGNFDTIYSNAYINANGVISGGLIGWIDTKGDHRITNCWYDGTITTSGKSCGGIAGYIENVALTVDNCLFTGNIISTLEDEMGAYAGGILGRITSSATLKMEACLSDGTVTTNTTMRTGMLIGNSRSNNEFRAVYATNGVSNAEGETISFTNGMNPGVGTHSYNEGPTWIGMPIARKASDIAGINGYKYTALGFYSSANPSGKWVARDGKSPALKSFVAESEWMNVAGVARDTAVYSDTSWVQQTAGTKEDPYIIADAADLYGLSDLSRKDTFKGKYFKVVNDITVNHDDMTKSNGVTPMNVWEPINRKSDFAGTFDGQGHTISGLYTDSSQQFTGLFGRTAKGSTVKNLRLVNSYFSDTINKNALIGGIAGRGNGTFDTIYCDAYIYCENLISGGIVGWVNEKGNHKITNCWYAGQLTTPGYYAGGIVGYLETANLTIDNCLFTGTVISTTTDEMGAYAGGILGRAAGSATLKLKSCLGDGTVKVKATTRIGMLIGASRCNVEYVATYATGDISNVDNKIINFAYGMNPGVGTYSNNEGPVWVGAAVAKTASDIAGINGYKYTDLGFYSTANTSGKWVARDGKSPALKSFVAESEWMSVAGIEKDKAVYADTSWIDDAKGTENDPYIIADAADLYGLAELSKKENFKGKYIEITNDIPVNTGNAKDWETTAPLNAWTPISKKLAFEGTLNGNGHTISGLYAKSTEQYTGLFGKTAKSSTVQNLRLENSYFCDYTNASAVLGSIAGYGEGNFDTVYSNAIVQSSGANVGGLVGWIAGKGEHEITNCWYEGTITSAGQNIGGIAGFLEGCSMNIKNALFTGTIISTSEESMGAYAGGIFGRISGSTSPFIMENILSAGTMKVDASVRVGTILGCCRASVTFTNVYTTNGLTNVDNETISFSNGMNPGVGTHSKNEGPVWTGEPLLKVAIQGTKGYRNTSLDFYTADNTNGKWITRNENVPALKSFVDSSEWLDLTGVEKPIVVGEPDTSWLNETAGTEADPYIISTAEDLYGFEVLSRTNAFSGKYIKLANDIIVNTGEAEEWAETAPENVWTPIGRGTYFAGTFDGDGHAIKGLYTRSMAQYTGLFGKTALGSTVKNLRVENSYFCDFTNANSLIGGVAGRGEGSFENIYCNAIIETSGQYSGGIVGWIDNAGAHQFTNCWFDGKAVTSYYSVGGILGGATHGQISLMNCLNSGTIISTLTSDVSGWVGGLIGYLAGAASPTVLEDCLNTGNISVKATMRVGTIIGGSRASLTFVDVYTMNTITNANGSTINFTNGMNPGVGTHSSNEGPVWSGRPVLKTDDELKGTNAYLNTELSFYSSNNTTGVWAARTDKTPVLKAFSSEYVDVANIEKPIVIGSADTSWMVSGGGTQANPYIIADAADLLGFVQLSATNNFSGKYIRLVNDITLNAGDAKDWANTPPTFEWTPIGRATAFAGNFDGDGHTIKGLYTKNLTQYAGFFGKTASGSMVKNLRIENSYFYCAASGVNTFIGSFAGRGEGNFENVYSNAYVVADGQYAGGIVGWINDKATHQLTNCYFNGQLTSTSYYAGGIIGGGLGGPITLKNCINSGTIISTMVDPAWGAYVGGIIGYLSSGASLTTLDGCINSGEVRVKDTVRVGAIIGHSRANLKFVNVFYAKDCLINVDGKTITFASGSNPSIGSFSNNEGPVWTGLPSVLTP